MSNERLPTLAATQLKIAALWLLFGLVMGIVMAATHDFRLNGVHAHINLLGWATLALTGLIYAAVPTMMKSRLAYGHFWLHNLGLVVMMTGLAAFRFGFAAAEPLIAVGAIATTLGVGLFVLNLFYRV